MRGPRRFEKKRSDWLVEKKRGERGFETGWAISSLVLIPP